MKRPWNVELPNGFCRNMQNPGDFADLCRRLPRDFADVPLSSAGKWIEELAVAVCAARALIEAQERRIVELEAAADRRLDGEA